MDGIIILDKPQGITSFKAVSIVKAIAKVKKAGHAGTLDPAATGILIVCLGKTCKKASDYMATDKTYQAEITFGITTDSGDADGKIINSAKADITREMVEKILEKFTGEIEQIPPMVSAIHHNGVRLYELARRGIIVERPPRKITINRITFDSFTAADNPRAVITVDCSKGTYIRTLCEDIGSALGCGAHESMLRRTKSGKFDISQAVTLEHLRALTDNGRLSEAVVNVD
jgi:tRNA pseudouridine55 synthase